MMCECKYCVCGLSVKMGLYNEKPKYAYWDNWDQCIMCKDWKKYKNLQIYELIIGLLAQDIAENCDDNVDRIDALKELCHEINRHDLIKELEKKSIIQDDWKGPYGLGTNTVYDIGDYFWLKYAKFLISPTERRTDELCKELRLKKELIAKVNQVKELISELDNYDLSQEFKLKLLDEIRLKKK